MTLAELKDAVRLLGAESSYEGIDETALPNFYNSLNRALCSVNRISPKCGSVALDNNARTSASGVIVSVTTDSVLYDFTALQGFMRFRSVPYREWGVPCIEGTDFRKIDEHTFAFPTSSGEKYLVDYEKTISPINEDTQDSYVIPLEEDMAHLAVLLVGYYLFLNDNQNLSLLLKKQYDEEYMKIYHGVRTSHNSCVATNNW